jgi:O-antigen biosynthesis protein WbqP
MKRAFDLLATVVGLAAVWPLMLVAMVAIRLDSPGPAIFAQRRVGRSGVPFICYKLRTMHADTAQLPTHEMSASVVTSVGRFLRRWKLDELPQLYNVLRGEMSLVGPRPCLPAQTELIEARLREGALGVRPGITGLAQVKGIDMSDPGRLAGVDGLYARTQSLRGDVLLLLRTFAGSGLNVDPARPAGRRSGNKAGSA